MKSIGSRSRSWSRILKVSVLEGVVSISSGQVLVSVSVSVSVDEVSVSDSEAETPITDLDPCHQVFFEEIEEIIARRGVSTSQLMSIFEYFENLKKKMTSGNFLILYSVLDGMNCQLPICKQNFVGYEKIVHAKVTNFCPLEQLALISEYFEQSEKMTSDNLLILYVCLMV